MSAVVEVSSKWLALREAEDARARSRELARAAAALMTRRPLVVHDLGSGTGSMMRWLAPELPGAQTWVLHDWNEALVALAVDGHRQLVQKSPPITARSRVGELSQLTADDLEDASLVTASALLDVLTARELHAIVRACVDVGSPALFTLSVTGETTLHPIDPRDDTVQGAFNEHQRRLADDRRLLGRYGGTLARGLFERAGWNVRSVASDWCLGDREPRLLAEWFDGWVGAAAEQRPELTDQLSGYRTDRAAQRSRGQLAARIHHTDLLAWPR